MADLMSKIYSSGTAGCNPVLDGSLRNGKFQTKFSYSGSRLLTDTWSPAWMSFILEDYSRLEALFYA